MPEKYIFDATFDAMTYVNRVFSGLSAPFRKIYFNNKHTTIEWSDGVKTTVGCIEGQEFDEYGGFTAALAKRLFGSSSAAIRFMNEHKEVQPEPIKKAKKASNEETTETAVTHDA